MKNMKTIEFSLQDFTYEIDEKKGTILLKSIAPGDWVVATYRMFLKDGDAVTVRRNQYTYVCDGAGHVAKSCCHKTDTFDAAVGIALAYARLRGKPIPLYFQPCKKTEPCQKAYNDFSVLPIGTRVQRSDRKGLGTVINTLSSIPEAVVVQWDTGLIAPIFKKRLMKANNGEI